MRSSPTSEDTDIDQFVLQFRLEQPMHRFLSGNLNKGKTQEQIQERFLSNADYLKNPTIRVECRAIHIGLNV
jgi:hypothetical protein